MKQPKLNATVEDSATIVINSLAQEKIAAGIKVFNLSAGEPKLPPHMLIVKSVIEALSQSKTFYPPVSGVPELKKLAADWMRDEYLCNFQPENCLVVNGGKLAIYLLLQLLLKNADEVIFASPYWVSYPAITKLFGGKSVIVETNEKDNWKITANGLKKACTSNSRILILNNGANPTGALYSKQELAKILQVAKQQGLFVLSDEVYSGLTYDKQRYISCGSFPQYQDNVVVIQSCSKNFSMTGWRVGFAFGPKSIIKQLATLLGQSTSGVTTISQWAAVAAIKQSKKINAWVCQEMQKRRNALLKILHEYFGIKVTPPASSLYLFIPLRDLGIKTKNSTEFCKQLLEHANVALVPGIAFGKEEFVRFSFGAEVNELKAGVKALAAFCGKL